MSKPRRHFSDPEKVAILKRHLLDKVAISDLCDELRAYASKRQYILPGLVDFDKGTANNSPRNRLFFGGSRRGANPIPFVSRAFFPD
jgi:transposase